MMNAMPYLRPRLRVWKEIFWKPWLGLVALVFSLVQIWQAIRAELRPDLQDLLRIFNLLPDLSWQTWLIGWLLIFLLVALEGSYRAIALRDRSMGRAVRRLTTLRETAIVDLFNRPVTKEQELETLRYDIEKWTNDTLDVLSRCASRSEMSSFRVLGALPGSRFLGVFNDEHNLEKLILNVRLERLGAICQRLEAKEGYPRTES
jgi:hypothetical protein